MSWNRLLWGIEFSAPNERPVLIGCEWWEMRTKGNTDEPSRALLFKTRAAARRYCGEQHAQYKGRTDCCGKWRFKPVRVRETVTLAAKTEEPR